MQKTILRKYVTMMAAGVGLRSSLSAYWHMDEATGNRADATGRGSTLTEVAGAIAGAAGKINNAAHVVRTDSRHLTTASSANVSFGNIPFTIVAWIKPATVSTQFYIVKGSNADKIEYAIYQAGGGFSFTLYNGTGTVALATASRTPVGMTGNYHFVAGRYDGNGNINITVDTTFGANVATAGGTPGVNTMDLAVGGRAGGGSNYADADIDEVGLWRRYLSNDELTRLYNGGAGLAYPFDAPYLLVFEGDSLTTGVGAAAGSSYPLQTLALLTAAGRSNYNYNNVAANGETIATMLTQAAAQVDALYKANYAKNIAILLAGTNDIGTGGRAAADVYADLKTWHTGRKAAGLKTIALTIPHRAYDGDPADINDTIDACNALIRADKAGADMLADIAADANLLDPNNATYFNDKLHLTAAGYAIVAGYADAAIRSL